MDWSSRHKFNIIGTLVGIIVVVTAVFVYFKFIKQDPTCFDGKKNQDERGIDCGGVCSLVCSADTKPVTVLWTRVIKNSDNIYGVVAYLENRNQGSGVRKVDYEIRVFDDKNILAVEPIKGQTFIGPNDRTAILEFPIVVENRIPKTAFITFTQPMVFEKVADQFNDQNLVISDDVLEDVETSPKLSVTVRNTTFATFRNVPLLVLLYNEAGNVVAASQTVIDEIGPEGETREFFTWREPFSEPVVRREVIPRIDPFLYK